MAKTDLLRHLVEQRLRVLQVARVEAFGEPGVDRRQQIAGGVALALLVTGQPTFIARTSAARSSTGITGSSPLVLTGRLRR
jgi:hypothetical protein